MVGQIKYCNKEYNSPCAGLGSQHLATSHGPSLTASKKEFNLPISHAAPIGQENVSDGHLTTTKSLLTSHTLKAPEGNLPPQVMAAGSVHIGSCLPAMHASQVTMWGQPSECVSGRPTDPGPVSSTDGAMGSASTDEMNGKYHLNVCWSGSLTCVPATKPMGSSDHQLGRSNQRAKDLSLLCVESDSVSVCHDARPSCETTSDYHGKGERDGKALRASKSDPYPSSYPLESLSPNTSMYSLPAELPASQGVGVRPMKRKRNTSIFPSKITRWRAPLKGGDKELLSEDSSDEPPVKKNSRVQERKDCQRVCLISSDGCVDGSVDGCVDGGPVTSESILDVHETLQSCEASEVTKYLNEEKMISRPQISQSPLNINKVS